MCGVCVVWRNIDYSAEVNDMSLSVCLAANTKPELELYRGEHYLRGHMLLQFGHMLLRF